METTLPPETRVNGPRDLEPMDPHVQTIQPGGGIVMSLELMWGTFRRWFIRLVFPGYVREMASRRLGDVGQMPFEPVDSRDLKYHTNQTDAYWLAENDRFRWRDSIPFARWGLAELFVLGAGWFIVALALIVAAFLVEITWLRWTLVVAGLGALVVCGLIVWFFRDPWRFIPVQPEIVVSPADGTIAEIVDIEDPWVGGPAIRIGIFLSIFNVHINRAPLVSQVIGVSYRPGKMLNALRPESARENERLEVRLQETAAPWRCLKVIQITGAIARRIVCAVKPGDTLGRGEKFGMIKLGSRTEIIIPKEDGLEIFVDVGDKVTAGTTIFARFNP